MQEVQSHENEGTKGGKVSEQAWRDAKYQRGECRDCAKPVKREPGGRRYRRCDEHMRLDKDSVRKRRKYPVGPHVPDAVDARIMALGRCKCGLWLPCVCVPTAADYARMSVQPMIQTSGGDEP